MLVPQAASGPDVPSGFSILGGIPGDPGGKLGAPGGAPGSSPGAPGVVPLHLAVRSGWH